MSTNPYQSPESTGAASERPEWSWSVPLLWLLGMACLAAAIVAVLFPPVYRGRLTAAGAFQQFMLVHAIAGMACLASVACFTLATYRGLRGRRR